MSIQVILIPFVLLALFACPTFAQEDEVKFRGIDAGEKVRVAVNARTASGSGCIAKLAGDEWDVFDADAAGLVRVGNLRSGCVLTIAAFSKKRAMLLATLRGWKDQGGERRVVTMKPPIEVPIVVWITHNDLEIVARHQVGRAAELYMENMVGFNFIPTFHNVSSNHTKVKIIESAVETVDKKRSICSNVGSLRGHAYKANTLNVYYVKREGLHRNCAIKQTPNTCKDFSKFPKVDGNVTYLDPGNVENPPLLAHELGHAFGLRPADCGGHTDLGSGFDSSNIMVGEVDKNGNSFSLGQAFRMNTQKDRWGGTMILANKLRPAKDGRECHMLPWEASTEKCPSLNLGLTGRR